MQNHRLLPPPNRPTRNRINFRTTPVNCPILKVFISPPEGFRNFAAAHSAGASGGVTEFQATAACQNTLRQSLGWFVRGHGQWPGRWRAVAWRRRMDASMPVYQLVLHTYRSWNADNPRGYVRRGMRLVLAPDAGLAQKRAALAVHAPYTLDAPARKLCLRAARSACGYKKWRLHAVAVDTVTGRFKTSHQRAQFRASKPATDFPQDNVQ